MPVQKKYETDPRMLGPGVPPHLREFAREVDEDVSFSGSSVSSTSSQSSTSSVSSISSTSSQSSESSSSASSESSEST
jgi:hypothetical protein